MTKVVVIGAGGFIGSSFCEYNKMHYEIIPVFKTQLNLQSYYHVKTFLEKHTPDIVLNCWSYGMSRTPETFYSDLSNNLKMFFNFSKNRNLFGKYINIGSGAEFDTSKNIENAKEYQIFDSHPRDAYGLSKNLISTYAWKNSQFTTLRLFGCFGKKEKEHRLLKQLLLGDIIINEDRYFDYVSINDLCRIINIVIDRNIQTDMNIVYRKKMLLSEIAHIFCEINSLKRNITVQQRSNRNYTGDCCVLEHQNILLTGIEAGMEQYVK